MVNDDLSDPNAALARRYGELDERWRGEWNPTLQTLLAHRSVRRFTADPVTDDTVAALVTAAQSASTSSNLHSWSVIAVRDAERRRQLRALAGDQAFITAAPIVLVWVADLSRARALAADAGEPLDGADFLESTLMAFVDTAIASQNALVAAESLGLGGVYIGAVRNNPEGIADLLGLPPHTIAVAGMAIGHPDPTDSASVKPRLPRAGVLHHEQYDTDAAAQAVSNYEGRLAHYYAGQGMSVSWRQTVLRRLRSGATLSGRDRIREALSGLGWPSR